MCIATHFDVSRARCYKFGGTKIPGYPSADQNSSSSADINHQNNANSNNGLLDDFISTLKDLTSINKTSDRKLWLVLIILITLSLLLLILILSLLRKHYLGYCWTAHKKEYEPNNTTAKSPIGGSGKSNHFDKNSINNKSFRRRNGEHDSDDSDYETAGGGGGGGTRTGNEDRSNLVSTKKNGDFVAVNLGADDDKQSSEQKRLNYHHKQGPLKSSTSTPV